MARILVIEDNSLTLDIFAALLRDAGHEVGVAATADLGRAEALARRYDLILVDLFLPDGTAIDLLRAWKNARMASPVIVVTGESSVETAVEAIRRGAIDYAVKPLLGDDLLAKVEWGLRYATAAAPPPVPPEDYSHVATRWAALVVAMLDAPRDIRTNREWARLVGVSTTTLRDWCRLAKSSAARSLALARLLRTVHLCRGSAWRPEQHLDVSDPRTLARLIARSGLPPTGATVTVLDLLTSQSFVDDLDSLIALRNALTRTGH